MKKVYIVALLAASFSTLTMGFAPENINRKRLADPFGSEFVMGVGKPSARDTTPIKDRTTDFTNPQQKNPLDLRDPNVIDKTVEYDNKTGRYNINEKIGAEFYRMPSYMTFEEYLTWRSEQQERTYFNRLAGISKADDKNSAVDPLSKLDPLKKFNIKNQLIDRLFGGTAVDIRPQGNIDLIFGGFYQNVANPILTRDARTQSGIDFDMNIRMNVTGKIGEKLNLSTDYNTQATFDFENQMKLNYNSNEFSEDEIIKKIEAGNVSLPLRGNLIQGAQSLFGVKTELQFGYLRLTGIASQQKSQRKDIKLQGGSQLQNFTLTADQYDENRHFFLSHYNRNNFEAGLKNMPQINTQFKITRLEVWVTNDRRATEGGIRNIVALSDIGEPDTSNATNKINGLVPSLPIMRDKRGYGVPDNQANSLYSTLIATPSARRLDGVVSTLQRAPFNYQQGTDFVKVGARRLSPTEYTYHEDLGFVSVNFNLQPNQVLGVAYEYIFDGCKTFKVGELSDTGNDATFNPDTAGVVFVKMLKSATQSTKTPSWNLMMKNVYSTGAYQVNQQDFKLDIFYEDPGKGEKRFLPRSNVSGIPLLQLFNLDNLNTQGDPQPDGVFDFVAGVTISPRTGRVMFPVLEPFGKSLRDAISGPLGDTLNYKELYAETVTFAREFTERNRFTIRGSYKSTVSSEISLGAFNIPRGSVRVSGGSQQLVEGIDYEVDYSIGRVKILNSGLLNSGLPINVTFEDNTLFGFQTKTLLGVRAEYARNKDFSIGATYMHLFERPFTQKVNVGEDPINNRIYGMDVQYNANSPWLTKAIDQLPFISTKAPSSLAFTAEAALIRPGHASAVNQGADKGGTVYIDDFEGSTSAITLDFPPNKWALSSVPHSATDLAGNELFKEYALTDSLVTGANRAKLNWFRVDDVIRTEEDRKDPYTADLELKDLFPNTNVQTGFSTLLNTFDLVYHPNQRGPYNFDLPGGYPSYTAGLDANGFLLRPETRWGGIQRSLPINDFEQSNVEFIEFWALSPYVKNTDPSANPGKLFIQLGSVSEDILQDSRNFYENGLPSPTSIARTDTTRWGRVPRVEPITNAFDNDPAVRERQDVGFDGLDDAGEKVIFKPWLDAVKLTLNADAYNKINDDPSNDNFTYFTDKRFSATTDIISRYSFFNNPQGNSQAATGAEINASNSQPDVEDLNNDNTLEENEAYYQYEIPFAADATGKGGLERSANDFIIDTIVVNRGLAGTWYHFKIPVDQFTSKVGSIENFRSIRFIRMFMTGFKEETILRTARFQLVRNQWRRYRRPLDNISTGIVDNMNFDVNKVNIEENNSRKPFNYVLPVGIQRERSTGAFPDALQNEQSLSLRIENLTKKDGRAIYKIINQNLVNFDRIRMFAHAERLPSNPMIKNGDMSMFVRFGSDFEKNYYEYEIPLTFSDETTTLSPLSEEYAKEVWRIENALDFPKSLLVNIKTRRNALNITTDSLFSGIDPENPNNTVRVIGNPNLGLVKGVMIGMRNTTKEEGDVSTKSAELWVNELRVNGLNEESAFATTARADIKLADLGTLTASGMYSTIGWGKIDEKLALRNREEIYQYDVASSIDLHKFLPAQSGIRLPMFVQYSNNTRTPEYDPYDLDVKLKDKLAAEGNSARRDSIRQQAQNITTIKSINFTNVRKERTGTKAPMPWDVENFSLTYAYTQTAKQDPIISSDVRNQYRGGLDYSFTRPSKYVTPFKRIVKKDKYLKLISEFNFNPLPNTFAFNSLVERQFQSTTYRFVDVTDENLVTFYNKRFTWLRNYNLQWDLTKALKISFSAINQSVIDEPRGRINTQQARDSVWSNIRNLGRTKNYTHNLTVNYTLPFKQIPFLDWVQVRAQYGATYGWNAAALNTDSLGNVIQNTQSRQINADLNLESFYNRFSYLKKINTPLAESDGKTKKSKNKNNEAIGAAQNNNNDAGNMPEIPNGDKFRRKDVAPPADSKNKDAAPDKLALGKDGKPLPVPADELNKPDSTKGKKPPKPKKEAEYEPSFAERLIIRPLMSIRKARFSYDERFGTIVPGFMPAAGLFGQEKLQAPGWDFVAGAQPNDAWLDRAAQRGWITTSTSLNQQVQKTYNQSITGAVNIEPFADFRLDLDFKRDYTENHSEFFKFKNGEFSHAIRRDMGTFSVSYFALNTMFEDSKTALNNLYTKFESSRVIISQRLGASDPTPHERDGNLGYRNGYGRSQQQVVALAFLATYSGKNPNNINTNVFKTLPVPNWRLTYNGLPRLPWFKDWLASMNITHGYKSTMTINSFATDLDYDDTNPTKLSATTGNYYSRLSVPAISITEQFSPLLGVDMRLKNDLNLRVDFKKARNLAMSFGADYQLVETKTTEYVVGFGYRLKDVRIPFLSVGGSSAATKKKKKNGPTVAGSTNQPPPPSGGGNIANDLNIKCDFSYRDDITSNHLLDRNTTEPTRGSLVIRLSPSAEYAINKQLSLRMFVDYNKTVPKTSAAFPITSVRGGLQLRFTLN